MSELTITTTLTDEQWLQLDRALLAAMQRGHDAERGIRVQREADYKASRFYLVKYHNEGIDAIRKDVGGIDQLRRFFLAAREQAKREQYEQALASEGVVW